MLSLDVHDRFPLRSRSGGERRPSHVGDAGGKAHTLHSPCAAVTIGLQHVQLVDKLIPPSMQSRYQKQLAKSSSPVSFSSGYKFVLIFVLCLLLFLYSPSVPFPQDFQCELD